MIAPAVDYGRDLNAIVGVIVAERRGHNALIRVDVLCLVRIQVADRLVHIRVFADEAADIVDHVETLTEFDEIDQVIERAVAPPALDVHRVTRPAHRREHHVIAAHDRVMGRVARV